MLPRPKGSTAGMPFETQLALAVCLLLGAALYTSVGHAGASAYIALMAMFGVAAQTMRPTALVLNVIAASFASWRYVNAGQFRWRTLWPVLVGAVPMAFVGGAIQLPGQYYRPLVGLVLLASAARFLWPREFSANAEWRDPPIVPGLLAGAAIGFLSGLTGTGGGIFLSPLLLFMAWSTTRNALGVAAVFILCNSVAGLLGNYASVRSLPSELPLFIGAVLIGAVIGTTIGIRLKPEYILKALGVVLLIAGFKLIGVY
jgi:uncharacterized membrane protein YfcA